MRDLAIERISQALVACPDLQNLFDISPEELTNLSNVELLDLYGEIAIEFYDDVFIVE